MAVKNASYIKSQIIDDDENSDGFITDDNGMRFVPETDDVIEELGLPQTAYAAHTHMVTETNNPIWNQVTYQLDSTVVSDLANMHVTLQGITDDGTINDIMQHTFTATTAGKHIFDLYGSSCTNAVNQQTRGGSTGGANTFEITMPKQYENYEDVDVMTNWFDSAWRYRIALQFERSGGKLKNSTGHSTSEYYGVNVVVPYKANMTDGNFTDIRFTATDGITELDFYILNFTASGYASCIVMVPWWFVDKEKEPQGTTGSTTSYAITDPQWIYCYYGNASATSASDITLGGNTFFYDDFEDNSLDTSKWTAGTTAHGTIQETGGKLQIDVASGYTEQPNVNSVATGAKFDGTDSFEVIFVIDELVPTTGTTAGVGPIFQLRADANNLYDCRFTYIASPTLGGTAAYHWNYFARNGGTSGSNTSTYRVNGGTTSDRYLKATYISASNPTGKGQLIWSVSLDGIYWDVIGRNYRNDYSTSIGGPTSGDVKLYIFGSNVAAAATAVTVKIHKVIMYPIVGQELEYMEDHFTNGTASQPIDRWQLAGTTNSTFTEAATDGGAGSGTPGILKLAFTNASAHDWTYSTQTCPIVYTSQKLAGLNASETCYYTAKIDAVNRTTGTIEGGIFLATGLATTTDFSTRFGVQNNGSLSLVAKIQSATSTGPNFLPAVTPTLPCYVRIAVDHGNKKVNYDWSQDGVEWTRLVSSASTYYASTRPGVYHKGAYMGMYALATTTVASTGVTFDFFRASTGMKPSVTRMIWNAEEEYADYPLETTTTDTDSMKLTFPMPTHGPKRGTCIQIRNKPHGADYINSKTMYVTNQDLINIGPDGTDKYIGLRLEFDFELANTDTAIIYGINYLYEVI
jgi:hypothetical protein